MEKPKKRSNFRLAIGRRWFIFRRRLNWLFGGHKFAQAGGAEILPFEYFSHGTPLFRQLKDVEMYMQKNKVVNLKIAAKKLQNVTIRPGETFSFWRLVGKPTVRKGYKKGMVLKSGRVESATGGGLCQMTNLIFWLAIHTPLTVVERHRHGFDVFPDSNREKPFGSGATCFYNYGDLMLRNDTDCVFQLRLEVAEKFLEGAFFCDTPPTFRYEVYESGHEMRSEFWGGYTRHNVIRRKKFSLCGELLDDEFVLENHAIMMYSPFITEQNGAHS